MNFKLIARKGGLGFMEFGSAKRTIVGVGVIQMIKKNHVKNIKSRNYRMFC